MSESAAKKAGKKGGAEVQAPRFGRVKANLKMGVLGLPNVGKSSLFNLLTEQAVAAENYPFCTIDPNESRCPVPDKRFEWLCDLWQPVSRVPAYLNITDIAGLIRGASEGAGLGNAFLSHISAVDGLYHVIRAFDNPEVVHVEDSVDPIRDLDTITYELCRKDQVYVDAVKAKKETEIKRDPKNKPLPIYYSTMEKIDDMLSKNIPLRNNNWGIEEVAKINELIPQALTLKPMVYLINVDAASYKRKTNRWFAKINEWVNAHGGGVIIPVSVEWEQQLWNLRDDPAAREAFLNEVPDLKSALPRIVKVGYNVLNLIYYFTAGEPEVRCWTIPAGACAPEAAGAIHSDFERGFIKAEVVSFDDFKALATGKSMAPIKAAGKYRQEGRNYVVQDGDIIHFMFNVTNKGK
jgi:obg-like ATPase 1